MENLNIIRNTIFLAFAGVLLASGLRGNAQIPISTPVLLPPQVVTSPVVLGWLWSSNIGWVSMSGATPNSGGGSYAVTVDALDNLSGYAWSSNIGWLSFNVADVASCPGGIGAKIDRANNKLIGWARFIAGGGQASGGWSGCVELSGTNHSVDLNPLTNKLTGYAWGGPVVGWLQFYDVTVPPVSASPIVDIKANGLNVLNVSPNSSVTLSWTSLNVDQNSCVGSIGWSGTKASPGIGTEQVMIGQTPVTYKITCSRAAPPGSATDSVTVTPCLPPQFLVGNSCVSALPISLCGNGAVDLGEQCDDGNTVSGDGCSSSCQIETIGPPGPPTFEEF